MTNGKKEIIKEEKKGRLCFFLKKKKTFTQNLLRTLDFLWLWYDSITFKLPRDIFVDSEKGESWGETLSQGKV